MSNSTEHQKPRLSKLAIASLVLSLAPVSFEGLVIACSLLVRPIFFYRRVWVVLWLFGPLLLSLFGLITGIGALPRIKRSRGLLKGRCLAIAGVIIPIGLVPLYSFGVVRFMRPARKMAFAMTCGSNLSALGKAMLIYANEFDGKLPTGNKWCDLLIKHAEVGPKVFVCPKSGVAEGQSSYAINQNAFGKTVSDLPPDLVLLFESKPGWNQVAGLETLTTKNHDGKGCNILFVDRTTKFVKTEELGQLKWNVQENQNSREQESGSGNFRRVANDEELKYWLRNMVWFHRFTNEETAAATGLGNDEISAALKTFDIRLDNRPQRQEAGTLLVLPYPGGRHPRIGFLEGAIDPQRETKFSVFTPWDPNSYVVVDMPEAIWSNLGLTYLAHTHIDTIWTKQGVVLPKLEWNRRSNGSLDIERELPNGIAFGAKVIPRREAVHMELWLKNGTNERLTDLRVQICVLPKMASGFEQQTDDNKIFTNPYVACRSSDGKNWIITAWENCHRPWGNERCPCFHSDPKFPDLEPGQTHRLQGWLSFYQGTDIEAEFERIEKTGWRKQP